MLTRLQLKQIKAALKGMADHHSGKTSGYGATYWIKKDDLEDLLETFSEPAPIKPKKEPKPKVPKKEFSRKSSAV